MISDGNLRGDSKDELLDILEKLPRQLSELYKHMLNTTVEREHLSESRRIFEFALFCNESVLDELDIMALFLGAEGHRHQQTKELLARKEPLLLKSWEESGPRCGRLQRRLKSRCAGLLEGTRHVYFLRKHLEFFYTFFSHVLCNRGKDTVPNWVSTPKISLSSVSLFFHCP